ncbi:hypothetical protein EG68_09906 [Paragonimus skrjabini miyazakii]|uniref:Uncharacterized protein n=1 Tax=Paragonimus skrjabini miyazakii TaxID=59628 RepID=A0A8S9YT97_9TREM|nr:hypothetical protein EG68_09906 [Paragonimus skrjabini miyazakii]
MRLPLKMIFSASPQPMFNCSACFKDVASHRNLYTVSSQTLQGKVPQTRKALKIGRPGKISVEDVTYLVRRDPKKFSRVKELLLLSEELRRARKAFEEDEYGVLK